MGGHRSALPAATECQVDRNQLLGEVDVRLRKLILDRQQAAHGVEHGEEIFDPFAIAQLREAVCFTAGVARGGPLDPTVAFG